jgi:hypothetical protein
MPKKRSAPHGRTMPKTKRVKHPVASPVAPAAEPGESNGRPLVTTPPVQPVVTPRSVVRPTAVRGGRNTPGLSTDYGYVRSDLKRIGIIAAGTFAILFGLSFVIK